MKISTGTILTSLVLLSLPTAATAAARKTPARAIHFVGAAQYSDQELMTAAGLNPAATRLTPAELKARARQLNDTGIFSAVKLNADARGITFTLMPATPLYPLHLDNLPLTADKALDEQIHQRVPLYHGQLPGAGSVDDSICVTLQDLLAAKGIHATVKSSLTSGLGPKKITAVNFTIASPAVKIGPLQLSGVSAAIQAKVAAQVALQAGNGFDTENTAPGLERTFTQFYQDQGYLAVAVTVTPADAPIVTADAIQIPFRINIREGAVYKFGAIRYPADAPVARALVDKALAHYPAADGRPLDLFLAALRDAYHAKGYMDCNATAQPVFNETTHTADYNLQILPGPAYRLGAVHFDGAPDVLLPKLEKVWTMAAGDTFDESYAQNFSTLAQKKDKALAKWLVTVLATVEVKTDADKQQIDCTLHFAKLPPTK